MRVHRDTIICVAASRSWSVIVSGSKDGTAVLWDLNRAVYMRSISHGEGDSVGVHLVAINESTVRTIVLSFKLVKPLILSCSTGIHCNVFATKAVSAHDQRETHR